MPNKILKVPQSLTRAAQGMAMVDADAKTVRMSISSDVPYKRYDWWDDEEYWEVLDHGPNGIDDERLKAGLPILFNHNRERHLGRGVSFECDGHKCEVVAKFSESEFAQEKFADIKSGVLVDTSVGYELIGDGICIGAKDELPIYKFRFKIYEGSLVTIPADATVGVGRQRDNKPEGQPREIQIKSLDESTNPSQNKNVANSPQMKISQLTRKHFRDKDEGGTGNGGEGTKVLTQADLDRAAEAALEAKQKRDDKIDDFCDPEKNPAMKNPAWHKAVSEVAKKHKKSKTSYNDFWQEALGHCVTTTAIDEPQRSEGRIQVIGERWQNGNGGNRALSIGAQFVRSKDFQELGPQTSRRRSITIDTDMSVLGIRGKVAMAQRAGFNSSDLTAINVMPMQQLVALGVQRLTVMDLIAPGTTSAAAIPYPVESTLGTIDGVALTGGKPYAGMTGERGIKPVWEPDVTTDVANVKKIAVVTKVPDEFLADFPGFQSYIDMRLPFMVDLKAEQQLLYGDGIGNNIKGITTFAGIQTRAYATTWADTIKKAITDIQVGSFFEPDGIVMHPYDWETASLEKDVNGQYLAGGPYYIPYGNGVFMMMRTFWGLPIVTTTVCTVGQPVVGCWKLGAQTFLREGMRIETTNSNEDDFKRNLIALRAEERLALAVYRPPCFEEITGGPART